MDVQYCEGQGNADHEHNEQGQPEWEQQPCWSDVPQEQQDDREKAELDQSLDQDRDPRADDGCEGWEVHLLKKRAVSQERRHRDAQGDEKESPGN